MERNDYYATGGPDPALNVATRLHAHHVTQEGAHEDIVHADEPVSRPSNVHRSSSSKDEKASLGESDEKVTSALPYGSNEKHQTEDMEDLQESFTAEDLARGVPFPESSLPHEEGNGLTLRALVVGTALGFIIAASNIYLGLKTGFTFSATLFASLLGFVIIKSLTKILPDGKGGSFFGPRENVTIQSAAAGSSGLTSMFVAAVPAMYRLGLLKDPQADFARLFTFCFCSAFYACFFAIPLRKFYILKQKLVFPTPTATALAIRAMHTANGAALARKKTKALGIAFGCSIVYCVVNSYVPGILLDQHVFYWFYSWGWKSAIYVDNWGWYTTITPAFFGSGMLAGMNASWSFLGGLFLGYAMIGPSLVATGEAKCQSFHKTPGDGLEYAYTCFSTTQYKPGKTTVKDASPRYWLIWPAVLMMFGYSFAEVAMNYKSLWAGIKSACLESYAKITGREIPVFEDAIPDPAPKEQQVPLLYVLVGLALSILMTILVCALQFHMNAGNAILAIILAFLFSFIGIQSSGTTDINPLSSVAKASQLIVGGAIKGEGRTGPSAQLENLIAGSIASSAAAHSVDMVGDLKTGHWLRASPLTQFYAQLFGSLWATPISVGLFVLFSKAYPCVLDPDADTCVFGAPSVAAWQAVSIAVVAPKLPVSLSSGLTAIILTVIAIATVVARYKVIPPKYHVYLPNWNAIGIGFLVPNCNYGIAMATGATLVHFWSKKYPGNADIYAYAIAAGLVAGEGIAGVINAILEIAGVSGAIKGTTVGVPPWLA